MKAKHLLYVLPVSLSLLTACSDEMEGQSTAMDNAIQVNAMIASQLGTDTRAVSSAESTTANLKSFYLTAYNQSEAAEGALIDGTKFVRQANSKWTDGGTYYWPLTPVRFVAVAASDQNKPALEVTADKITATGFTVEPSGAADFEVQKDYIAAVKTTQKPDDTNVIGLNFQHLLSRVCVSAYAPDYSADGKVGFAAMAFEGVAVKGDFARTNDETTQTIATSCWTNQETGNIGAYYDGTNASSVWYGDGEFAISKSEPATGSRLSDAGKFAPWLNVIPGTNVATKLHLSAWTGKECYDLVLDLPATLVTEYKPGYQYVYRVRITGKDVEEGEKIRPEIELEGVTVNVWNSESVDEVNIEADGDGGTALKKYLEEAKTFATVTMQQDVICGETIEISKDVNLNLSGYTLTSTAETLFDIKDGGKLRILGSGLVDVASAEKFMQLTGTGKLILKGGTYLFDPSAYCHADYEAVEEGEGDDARWTVQLKPEPAPEPLPEPDPQPIEGE